MDIDADRGCESSFPNFGRLCRLARCRYYRGRRRVDSCEYRPHFVQIQNLRIALVGECLKDFNFAYVDHIEIRGYLDNNLQATGITGPDKVNFKEEAKYVVSVLNEGVRDASQFAVYLTDEEFNVLATKQ